MLDETLAATGLDTAAPAWRGRAVAPAAKAAALVLFVGAACRPAPQDSASLAHEGMRSLWLPGPAQVMQAARAAQFDAMVTDAAMLADRGGARLAQLRAAVQCPILLLAEHGDEIDEIVALEMGADAYLQRPVAPRRLRAHLSVLIGRHRPPREAGDGAALGAGESWQVDRVGNALVSAEQRVALTDVQCALLQCLLQARGRIVPRGRLAAALPNGHAVHARSIDVYLHRLRKRLREAGVIDLPIEAARGRGYRLCPPA